MAEFKVGDRVRYGANPCLPECFTCDTWVGRECVVHEISTTPGGLPYLIVWRNKAVWAGAEQLELIPEVTSDAR